VQPVPSKLAVGRYDPVLGEPRNRLDDGLDVGQIQGFEITTSNERGCELHELIVE